MTKINNKNDLIVFDFFKLEIFYINYIKKNKKIITVL
jgi:hypothetical protein